MKSFRFSCGQSFDETQGKYLVEAVRQSVDFFKDLGTFFGKDWLQGKCSIPLA
jgi:hypothetical protein